MKCGDVVNLKSGGMCMTVYSVLQNTATLVSIIRCAWFNKQGDLCSENFVESTLELSTPAKTNIVDFNNPYNAVVVKSTTD